MNTKTLLLAAVVSLTANAASAEPINLTLSGGNPGGLWSLLGAGIDRATKSADAASVITYQATGGGFANIGLLSQNRVDLGLVHNAEAKLALAGAEPFRKPVTNMRAVGYMYNWAPMHFFLRKSIADQYGIKTLADIAKSGAAVRIGINRPGNITSNVSLKMLEASGVTEKLVASKGGSFVRAGANDQADLLKDGRIDMVTNGVFILHSSFRAIDENNEVVLLSIPDEAIKATNDEFGTQPYVIPGGSYRFQPTEVSTLALGALLVTHESVPEDKIYQLTRAVVGHIDDVRAVHKSMQELNPKLFASQTVLPFHPGAERALRDAGLLK